MTEPKKEVLYLIIDPSTGEVVNEISPGDKISSKESHDNKRRVPDQYDVNFNSGENFVKLYPGVISVLYKKLTMSEFALAISLSNYVSYGDCMLRANGNTQGASLTISDIANLMGREYKSFNRTFKSLINKGVVGKFSFETGNLQTNERKRISGYFVNPYIYSKGKVVNKTVLKLFSDTGWKEFICG